MVPGPAPGPAPGQRNGVGVPLGGNLVPIPAPSEPFLAIFACVLPDAQTALCFCGIVKNEVWRSCHCVGRFAL